MIETTNDQKTDTPRLDLARLAEALLRYYDVHAPPVPIERMLQKPPTGISIDFNQISFIMEHGLYRYEPRMAMARLLYREIAHSLTAQEALGVRAPQFVSPAEVKFFARCLLMPPGWLKVLAEQGLSLEQISGQLQVPSDAVIIRLTELGLPVPGTE